jgi:hypothetical protein
LGLNEGTLGRWVNQDRRARDGDKEWQQFIGHFERRKVSVGTCGRAAATPASMSTLACVAHSYGRTHSNDPGCRRSETT